MTAAEITAIVTGIPAIIAAVTALVVALRAHGVATTASNDLASHEEASH